MEGRLERAHALTAHLEGLGCGVQNMRHRREGDIEWIEVFTFDPAQQAGAQAAAAAWEASPPLADRIRIAASRRGVTVEQIALAAVAVARADGVAPPSWALPILRALVADVEAEMARNVQPSR